MIDGVEYGTPMSITLTSDVKDIDECCLCLLVEGRDVVFCVQFVNRGIDEGSKWFHDVIREGKGICLVVVEESDCWVKSNGNDGTGNCRAQNRVTVVEQKIGWLAVRVTVEIRHFLR